jgi:hypothetical protein
MSRSLLSIAPGIGALLCAVFLASTPVFPQVVKAGSPATSIISLIPEANDASAASAKEGEASFGDAPANFHSFASARVGEDTFPEQLTLRFSAPTMLTGIKSSKDFQVQQGSTCNVHAFYSAGSSCACWFALHHRVRVGASGN